MKNLILIPVLLFNCFSIEVGNVDGCSSCQYEGGVQKLKVGERPGQYVPVNIQLGEFMLSLVEDSCEIDASCLYLAGAVCAPIPDKKGNILSPESGIILLKATSYDHRTYSVVDTLARTDENGRFSFKVYNSRTDGYILVVQRDGTCLRYSIGAFKN